MVYIGAITLEDGRTLLGVYDPVKHVVTCATVSDDPAPLLALIKGPKQIGVQTDFAMHSLLAMPANERVLVKISEEEQDAALQTLAEQPSEDNKLITGFTLAFVFKTAPWGKAVKRIREAILAREHVISDNMEILKLIYIRPDGDQLIGPGIADVLLRGSDCVLRYHDGTEEVFIPYTDFAPRDIESFRTRTSVFESELEAHLRAAPEGQMTAFWVNQARAELMKGIMCLNRASFTQKY